MNDDLLLAIRAGRDLAEALDADDRPFAAGVVRTLTDLANRPAPMRAFVNDDDQRAHEAEQQAASTSRLENKPKSEPAGHRHKWQFDAGLGREICMADPDCKAKPRKKREAPAAAVEGGSQS